MDAEPMIADKSDAEPLAAEPLTTEPLAAGPLTSGPVNGPSAAGDISAAADGMFDVQEKVLVVEERRSDNDTRRHFVGQVVRCDSHHLRVRGHLFVYHQGTGLFTRVSGERTRVFFCDNRIGVTVLPADFQLDEAAYERADGDLIFTDQNGHDMEFGMHG